MTEIFGLVLLGMGWLAGRFLVLKPKQPSEPEADKEAKT